MESPSSNAGKAYRILSYESKKIQKEAIPLDEAIYNLDTYKGDETLMKSIDSLMAEYMRVRSIESSYKNIKDNIQYRNTNESEAKDRNILLKNVFYISTSIIAIILSVKTIFELVVFIQ